MSWIADNQSVHFDQIPEGRLLSIGWLARGRPFSTGNVPEEFFFRLARLLVNPWEKVMSAGFHDCEFCRYTGGPRLMQVKDLSITIGCTNVVIPSKGLAYFAPSMVLHYIDAHDYAPPVGFIEAVMGCPEMRSMAYFKQLKAACPELVSRDC